jgi:hypothetical protein
MGHRKKWLIGGAVLLLGAGAGVVILRPAPDGPHDLVEDISSGPNGPLALIEGWMDESGKQGEIAKIERLPIDAASRKAVAESLRASERSAGRYSLLFRGPDGKETGSQAIEGVKRQEREGISFRVATNIPSGTETVAIVVADDAGEHHEISSRRVQFATTPDPRR